MSTYWRAEQLPDGARVPDGTILVFYIVYPQSRSQAPYTYVGIKANGRWWITGGSISTPRDAGWGAVKQWLLNPERRVVGIYTVDKLVPVARRSRPENRSQYAVEPDLLAP